jgi:hypothetical protein
MERNDFSSASSGSMYFLESILLLDKLFLASQNRLPCLLIPYRFEVFEQIQPLLA